MVLAAAGASLVAAQAGAQTVLSDYESADQAQKVRDNALWRLAFRPTLQVLDQTIATLQHGAKLSAEDNAAIAALTQKARSLPEPEARRTYWEAVSRVLGRRWDATQEMVGALSVKVAHPVISESATTLDLATLYPVTPAASARFSIVLFKGVATSSATPQRGENVRELASGTIGAKLPRTVPVSFAGVPDGFYLLLTRVTAPDGASSEIATPFYIVHDLGRRQAALERKLQRVTGHDAARQTALYPFALASALNAGTREVISYDFNAAIARSEAIVSDLLAGKDSVKQAKGLQSRAYRFAETGELIPYQIFVPSAWTPDRKWPLVVALHGANLDETNMLGRAGGRMQQLAEQRGVIVVAPLGYRINSAYGSQRGMGRLLGIDDTRLRRSEADVLAVTDLVTAEYSVDPERVYLTGNSMGGGGTWWIGGQHPERWAAIAPAAFGGVIPEDVPGLSRLPILAVVGDKDELGMLDRVKSAVSILRQGGVRPGYLEVAGGTHSSAFDTALPRILDFFESHRK